MRTRQICGRHCAATTAGPAARHASPASGRTRRRSIVAVVTVGLLGGGVALAAWSVSGSSGGQAGAIADDRIHVQAGEPTVGLFPGGTSGVTLRVKNPLPYPVVLTKAHYGAVTTTSGSCASTFVTPVASETSLAPITLAANQTEETDYRIVELPGALRMSAEAVDGCKGADFRVEVTFTGQSSGS